MIIYNAIKTPDGTIVRSKNRHDYNCYTDANGFKYCVDGGSEYLRRAFTPDAPPYEDISVDSEDVSHEVARTLAVWGTYGVDGKQPLKYVTPAEMEDDHIRAILNIRTNPDFAKILQNELTYRENKE